MDETPCSTASAGLIALWAAELVLVIPLVVYVGRRIGRAHRRLGYPASHLHAWKYFLHIDLPSIIGRTGATERIVYAILALLLLLPFVGLPIGVAVEHATNHCAAPHPSEQPAVELP